MIFKFISTTTTIPEQCEPNRTRTTATKKEDQQLFTDTMRTAIADARNTKPTTRQSATSKSLTIRPGNDNSDSRRSRCLKRMSFIKPQIQQQHHLLITITAAIHLLRRGLRLESKNLLGYRPPRSNENDNGSLFHTKYTKRRATAGGGGI